MHASAFVAPLLRIALWGCLEACAWSAAAATAPYPARPVRLLVPFTPGGSQDVIARMLAQKLSERLGHPVVVDNRPGAAGLIAAELTARAAPDGHTLLLATGGQTTIARALRRKLNYDPLRDLAPVVHLVDTPMALVVSATLAAHSVHELVALAKARPGRMSYASVGIGSISHLTMELFAVQTGLQLVHVPYKGAAPALVDLVAGQVPLLFITTASAQPHVAAGKARALAVAARRRSEIMPDVPTLSEAGIRDMEVPVWSGIMAPAGTPKPVIERLYRETRRALELAEIRERLAQLGSEVAGAGPQAFASVLAADLARWIKLAKSARIQLD